LTDCAARSARYWPAAAQLFPSGVLNVVAGSGEPCRWITESTGKLIQSRHNTETTVCNAGTTNGSSTAAESYRGRVRTCLGVKDRSSVGASRRGPRYLGSHGVGMASALGIWRCRQQLCQVQANLATEDANQKIARMWSPDDACVADYLKVTMTHAAALRHSRHLSLRGLRNLILPSRWCALRVAAGRGMSSIACRGNDGAGELRTMLETITQTPRN
jgi:hypothetical protein